jgi:hypothetical protein
MNDAKLCKNPNCSNYVEPDRPKGAKFCKACGARRSRDWKREHPERTKLYVNEEAVKNWRERNHWNNYIQNWRKRHPERSREQTRRAVRTHREHKRRIKEGTYANAPFDCAGETSSHQTSENGSPTSHGLKQNAVKETRTTEPIIELAVRLAESAAAARHRRWMQIALMIVVLATILTCLYVSFSSRFTAEEKKYANSTLQDIMVGLVGFLTGRATTKNNSPPG